MSASAKEKGRKTLLRHRKARYDFVIDDTIEAGISLLGSEVKSLRESRGSLTDAFARERNGELWLIGAKIDPYPWANQFNHQPNRERKLLLHKREIRRLSSMIREKGYTLVPLAIYLKDSRIKVEIALARGKRQYEKRETKKAEEARREIDEESGKRRRSSGSAVFPRLFSPTARTLPAVLAWLALPAIFCYPADAVTAPLLDPHQGGIVLVGPTSAHPSAVFWNPAAMGIMKGHHLLVQASGRFDRLIIDRATISSATGEPDPAGDKTFSPVDTTIATPSGFLGAVFDFGMYRLGIAAYTPFSERLPDAPEIAYHARGGSYYALFTTVSLAIRASSMFSVGFGFSTVESRVDLRFDRDRGLEDCPTAACSIEDPALAEHYTLTGDLLEWPPPMSLNAGILLRLPALPRLTIGVAYITAPSNVGRGDIAKKIRATVAGKGPDYEVSGNGRITFGLPQIANFGVRYGLSETVDLVADFRWIGYRWLDRSTHRLYELRPFGPDFAKQRVPEWIPRYRTFGDVFSVKVGVDAKPTPRLQIGGRAAFETSAVATAQVAADQIDAAKLDLGVGASYYLSDRLSIAAGYSLIKYFDQDVSSSLYTPEAYRRCRDSGYDLDACEQAQNGLAIPTAAGHYSRLTHDVSADVTYHW
ncbi:MAG: SsrA-binding protein SmpB [Pseudomonadota bacterium]